MGISTEETTSKYADCVYKVGMNKVDETMTSRLITACMEADGFCWIPAHFRPFNAAPHRSPTHSPHSNPSHQ